MKHQWKNNTHYVYRTIVTKKKPVLGNIVIEKKTQIKINFELEVSISTVETLIRYFRYMLFVYTFKTFTRPGLLRSNTLVYSCNGINAFGWKKKKSKYILVSCKWLIIIFTRFHTFHFSLGSDMSTLSNYISLKWLYYLSIGRSAQPFIHQHEWRRNKRIDFHQTFDLNLKKKLYSYR